MSTRFRSREFGRLPVSSVAEWLRRAGWSVKADGKGGLLCEGPLDDDGNPVTRTLPHDESYGDYDLRLEDLVATLAVLEERPALQIILEMAAVRAGGQVVPPRIPLGASDLMEILRQSHGGVLSDEQWRGLDRALPPPLENAVLVASQARTFAGNTIEAVAVVAVRLAHLLPVIELTKLAPWRVCSRLLQDELALTPDSLDKFYEIAAADAPDDPQDTVEWLEHRLPVREDTPPAPQARTTRTD